MKSLPPGVEPYRRTAEFSESTVPAGLLRDHTTRAGVWGRIRVLGGSLLYRIGPESRRLEPGVDGIVEPEVAHHVEPAGSVRFFVEFNR